MVGPRSWPQGRPVPTNRGLPGGLIELAGRQQGVLTTVQLRQAIGANQITRALDAGRLVRLWQGAYALPERAGDLRTRLLAADLTLGVESAACTDTAAALYGFDLSSDSRIHVIAPGACASKSKQLVLHRDRILSPLVRLSGQLTVGAAETAVAVAARQRDGMRALAVLDAALRSRAAARDEMREVADLSRINNIRRVRMLIDWADPRAESPRESWLRWLVLDARLPAPQPQHWVQTRSDQWYRLDLAWPEFKVACEYDGVEFHTGERLFADRARLNALTRMGWKIAFVTAPMLWSGRDALVADLTSWLR